MANNNGSNGKIQWDIRDLSDDELTSAHDAVNDDLAYGAELRLLKDIFTKKQEFKHNTDIGIVAAKICLIDVTNILLYHHYFQCRR